MLKEVEKQLSDTDKEYYLLDNVWNIYTIAKLFVEKILNAAYSGDLVTATRNQGI